MGYKLDLMQVIYFIYCIYALYSCFVVFYRPDERGKIFRNLRIPLVVFLYFFTPCIALFLIYKAFWGVQVHLYWLGVLLVLPVSFFIILYFVTSQDWPVGTILCIDRISPKTMRVFLSINFTVSLLVVIVCGTTICLVPEAISKGRAAQKYQEITRTIKGLEKEKAKGEIQVGEIRREATTKVLDNFFSLLTAMIAFPTTIVSFLISMKALKQKPQ